MSNIALNIAASGVQADQTAMDTIAQNLSNTNTPGYVSETANLATNPGGKPVGVGSGVRVSSVTQVSDSLLVTNAQQTSGALAQGSALQQVLQQAQLAFQEPTSNGMSNDLANFWQSWDAIASNPSDPAARIQTIDQAQTVATDLQQANTQLTTVAANATSELGSVATEANGLLSQVATLNTQIASSQFTGTSPNALIDQRNQAMNQLAKDIGAVGSTTPAGSYQVKVGNVVLVNGGWSDTLSVPAPTGTGTGIQPIGLQAKESGATVSVSAGTAAGLIAGVNNLSGFQTQLNGVASKLYNDVNTALGNGYTYQAGVTPQVHGGPLFVTSDGSTTVTAANISVSPAMVGTPSTPGDPSMLAAATDPSNAANDGSNAQAIASMWNSAGGSDSLYRSLVQQVGQQVSSTNNQVQSQTAVANAAQQNLQAVTGVDPNTQLVSLMNFQQAYQAAAKVISTVDTAMQSLIAAV